MTPDQLKNSILQLAIQGKLVEQRPEEGTAEELYKQIQVEKQEFIKQGKIKKEKPLPPIKENEYPYTIPDNWAWIRFGDLGLFKKGPFGSALTKNIFVSKGKDTIKVYEQKNAIQKNPSLGDYYISKEYFETKMTSFEVFPGDIIVSCAGTIGETYVMPSNIERGIINQALMRMRLFTPIYIPYFLIFFDFVLKQNAKESSKGSAIKNIPPFEILKNYLVSLPPIAEQQRIVAKIEELLPMVEKYGEAYNKLEALNKNFPAEIKKSILQYAIQGKLVEQRPEEGTAEELYKQIQVEKAELIKQGKLKKEKPLATISQDEIPFDIPETWKWTKIDDLFLVKSSKRVFEKDYVTSGIPFYRSKEIGELYRSESIKTELYITEDHYNELKEKYGIPQKGDILITSVGSIGNTWICDNRKFYYKDGNIIQICNNPNISSSFVEFFLHSSFFNKQIITTVAGTAYFALTIIKLKNIIFPLPPLAEQHRIVAKIEELFALVDSLSNKG